MPRIRRILLPLIASAIIALVFVLDILRVTVDLGIGGLSLIRELFVLASFGLTYMWFESTGARSRRNIPKEIGRILVLDVGLLVLVGLLSVSDAMKETGEAATSIRLMTMRLVGSYVFGIAFVLIAIITMKRIREMVLFKRSRTIRRNYLLYLGGLAATAILSIPAIPAEWGFLVSILFAFTIVMAVVNAFKQSWIVFLSRREKMYTIGYAGLLFVVLTVLDVIIAQRSGGQRAILAFSGPMHSFVQLTFLFATLYSGMAFVSTLFHLPTAEVFERKQSELNSLHTLGRLVTQVFDYDDLLRTITQMATEVCGSRGAWLELASDDGGSKSMKAVAHHGVAPEHAELLNSPNEHGLRQSIDESQRVMVIDDIWEDRRTKHAKQQGIPRLSLLAAPMLSHGDLIGILYVAREAEQGFDQDDLDVMSGFAAHATIAIENALLIARSMERERMEQELMVARRMQKRLLPQTMPSSAHVEFAAISESSAEVGGDYYDFFELERDKIGVVVADVSGKGVSAAFYMAEMKGIFLSLMRLSDSPKQVLIQANRALLESLEKNAFISVVYGVLDVTSGEFAVSRAGHCPFVWTSATGVDLVRPNGIGLGLTHGTVFEQATEERMIRLKKGDSCVFYTDGVTEARRSDGEEFGYERLVEAVRKNRDRNAEGMKTGILDEIRTFSCDSAYTDDMTLVVIKWLAE